MFANICERLYWFTMAGNNWPVVFLPTCAVSHSSLMLRNTHPFNGPFSRTTRVSWYQKGKNHLDFTEARDSEWQWHQLSHMRVCISFQSDNHSSTPPLSFYRPDALPATPINSVKALKAMLKKDTAKYRKLTNICTYCILQLALNCLKIQFFCAMKLFSVLEKLEIICDTPNGIRVLQ